MGKRSIEVDIKPNILLWARRSSGYDTYEIAHKLKIEESTIKDWEEGKLKPTLVQLENLAYKIYKRPLAAFFLSNPPPDEPPPKDFRKLPGQADIPLSAPTLLAIRKTKNYQKSAKEFIASSIYAGNKRSFDRLTPETNIESFAEKIRTDLGISISGQFEWKNEYDALNSWRRSIENKGVLVFQVSLDLNETRAFSLHDDIMPAIVLSSRDYPKARMFSLLHEYAHILAGDTGICGDMPFIERENIHFSPIEMLSNYFAGAVLVPERYLVEHELVIKHGHRKSWDDIELLEIANDFKVSTEVILRRLVILERCSKSFYAEKRKEWLATVRRKKSAKIKISAAQKCLSEFGFNYTNLILGSYHSGKIDYADLRSYLNIKLKHIDQLEALVMRRSSQMEIP